MNRERPAAMTLPAARAMEEAPEVPVSALVAVSLVPAESVALVSSGVAEQSVVVVGVQGGKGGLVAAGGGRTTGQSAVVVGLQGAGGSEHWLGTNPAALAKNSLS